jgi:hypothetical protein
MRALVLNGAGELDATAAAARDILFEEFGKRQWEGREFVLRDEKIAYCAGCFGCWIKTPGECVIADVGRDIVKAIMASDLVVYLTPVTFGGYSSELKKALDRMIPILSPFFMTIGGETHHQKRYGHYPRMLALGILLTEDAEAAEVFETLHSRNAINAHAPAAAAGTVASGASAEEISGEVEALLTRIGDTP